MNKKSLQLQQLDQKMKVAAALKQIAPPPAGWIKAVRSSLGISLELLGKKLSVTKQAVTALEAREKDGSITIKSLREAAKALDMQLVYALVPNDGSLEALIERKAKALATEIVLRTSNSMKLEDQENTKERIEKAIEEQATAIKHEMPKALWN
jgi:predicted DNA-binding mobile mystery protein A